MNQPILLCTVGTSWAVVPEAMSLFGERGFSAVHVLTTASPRLDEGLARLRDYLQHHPVDQFTLVRVRDFADLRSEKDHAYFEEVLFRWFLHSCPDPARRWVCLAGGYKTISAAMQRAASLFGAAEVFHVLCEPRFGPNGDREASTREEVERAIREGSLHFVRLGGEPGWPQLTVIGSDEYPLQLDQEGGAYWASVENVALSQRVANTLERSRHITSAWDRLAELPFPSLATWPPQQLAWLEEPLDLVADAPWVQALPKVELHCHLGGFATHGELLRQVRQAADEPECLPPLQEPERPTGWPLPPEPISLSQYMQLGDATGSNLLKDPGCLRKQCQLLYRSLVADHVVYAEIRCSPANYADRKRGRSPWDVLADIRQTFQQEMDSTPASQRCHVNLLLVATREESGDRSRISKNLALAITGAEHWREGCRVVGVDLAGFEHRETRAALFATDFEPIHRVGLAVTVHAGENDDVEGIWQAVFKLNARRLGHALHLFRSGDLLRAVAERGIGVEMCPYANFQIRGYPLDRQVEEEGSYPLLRYLRAGVAATVNTDNIGISGASLSENLLLTARLCPGFRRMDLLRLLANAGHQVFTSSGDKRKLLSLLSTRIARVTPNSLPFSSVGKA